MGGARGCSGGGLGVPYGERGRASGAGYGDFRGAHRGGYGRHGVADGIREGERRVVGGDAVAGAAAGQPAHAPHLAGEPELQPFSAFVVAALVQPRAALRVVAEPGKE